MEEVREVFAAPMSRSLRIRLTNARPSLIHSFRNFGEDVYRDLRDTYDISIEEIDAATEQFHVGGIPNRDLRRVAGHIRKLSERCGNLIIHVEEVRAEGDA